MGLIEKQVSIIVSLYNLDWYVEKGYGCKNGDRITVKVQDLTYGSGAKIDVECDYCGKIFKQAYRRYMEHPLDVACIDCRYKKVEKTNLQRYGCTCTMRDKEIQRSIQENSMEKYGTPYPVLSKQSIEKGNKTKIERYGTAFPLQNKEIWEKCNKTMNFRSGRKAITTSKNQNKLHKIYGGELNAPIAGKFTDILLGHSICFEYDGGGHRLRVIKGKISDTEFDEYQRTRDALFISLGYKIFRLISIKDRLFENKDMLKIKEDAINILLNTDNNIYEYDIENKSEKSYRI
jgi:hypothetical protein